MTKQGIMQGVALIVVTIGAISVGTAVYAVIKRKKEEAKLKSAIKDASITEPTAGFAGGKVIGTGNLPRIKSGDPCRTNSGQNGTWGTYGGGKFGKCAVGMKPSDLSTPM